MVDILYFPLELSLILTVGLVVDSKLPTERKCYKDGVDFQVSSRCTVRGPGRHRRVDIRFQRQISRRLLD